MVSDRNATGDPQRDAETFQRGDVLAVFDDSHQWSPAERSDPIFQAVSVPGISVATLYPLTLPDPEILDGLGEMVRGPTWRLRRNRIDLAVLRRLLDDVPAWLALLEEGGQAAAFDAGLIVAVPPPPPRGV